MTHAQRLLLALHEVAASMMRPALVAAAIGLAVFAAAMLAPGIARVQPIPTQACSVSAIIPPPGPCINMTPPSGAAMQRPLPGTGGVPSDSGLPAGPMPNASSSYRGAVATVPNSITTLQYAPTAPAYPTAHEKQLERMWINCLTNARASRSYLC